MQINNTTSTNFYGYKNVLANTAKISTREGLSMLSMQIDNSGRNDLDFWFNVQEKLLRNKNLTDVLTIGLLEGLGISMFCLNGQNIDPERFNNNLDEEKQMLKTYSWMADLLNRIKDNNYLFEDIHAFETFRQTCKNILPILHGDTYLAHQFAINGFNPANKPQEVASYMNEEVNQIMLDYLS